MQKLFQRFLRICRVYISIIGEYAESTNLRGEYGKFRVLFSSSSNLNVLGEHAKNI